MLDFASRRFTIRLGRTTKSGEQAGKRMSVVGRRASARRVSVRKSTALRRAPSGAGGLHRGTSVRRSQSGVRRGASVRRAPSAARRNSKRISTYVDGILPCPPSPSFAASNAQPDWTALQQLPVSSDVPIQSVTSPTSSKSFFSKLTSRFRGRSKPTQVQIVCQPAPAATLSPTNLAPLACAPPRSPSLRSPSPGSRVTFVDSSVEPTKVSDVELSTLQPRLAPEASDNSPEEEAPVAPLPEQDEQSEEWVDADEDEDLDSPQPEPHTTHDAVINSVHASSDVLHSVVPVREESQDPNTIVYYFPVDEPETTHLQAEGADVRVSQWLAVTPVVVVDEQDSGDNRTGNLEREEVQGRVVPPKELKKRPLHIVVPEHSIFSSNNPFRVPLPPSPSPPTLPESNPFRSLASDQPTLEVEAVQGCVPPSPSILLTPAGQFNHFEEARNSDEFRPVDASLFPLPPSPSPSHVCLSQQCDDAPATTSPQSSPVTVVRTGSCSTSGGRSLSTAPSTLGPTTPTSARIPGHPAFAHFSFGGPSSPSLKVEDWEEGEEERRGRSLEVNDGSKRRMRSASPRLDAVLEGDESRRSSRASFEGQERKSSGEDTPALGVLPAVEEVVAFGQKREGDAEDEDEAGFFAFAERQMEEEKKATEARQLGVPKRSKTMSFLGFGKRKSTVGEPPQIPRSPSPRAMARSATAARLLGPPVTAPKRSSTLVAPPSTAKRSSRLIPGQRSSTMLAEPLSPRTALSPTMYSIGDIQAETGKIEDDESRRLSEAMFMF